MNILYPWLESHYQQITHAFAQGHGHHALLFKADLGLGIEQLIAHIAHWILCQGEPKPCDNCHACRLFNAVNHPDFYHLQPVDDKDIGIDQIREINEKVSQHAQQNGNKIVYIQDADRLTEAASNALLKTLEEPKTNTYFLLQTNLASSLLPTIYSRCQTWLIPTPDSELTLNWLQKQTHVNASQISTALRVNYGRPLMARHFLQNHLAEKRTTLITQFWKFYQRSDILQVLPQFEKEIIFQQLDWLSAFLMDSLKAKSGIYTDWVCMDFERAIEQFAAQNTLQTLLAANQILQQTRSNLATINAVNQELMLIDGLSGLILNKHSR
ncbi:DNA polymerase III subunit delta' [Conservatibacter flavescens]|uniref:DNA polymerase III subunit delta' n=1 Tax=Conservatibacter flavescens TaxID=28161 RepID=A0A2M8S1W9_9PAST|nr:DNA polymerase III subunit delta' [Conservatibacter flavescens]PJG85114.1 DNA polymerase III subunit delta' [Conservatibacter flavescens]